MADHDQISPAVTTSQAPQDLGQEMAAFSALFAPEAQATPWAPAAYLRPSGVYDNIPMTASWSEVP